MQARGQADAHTVNVRVGENPVRIVRGISKPVLLASSLGSLRVRSADAPQVDSERKIAIKQGNRLIAQRVRLAHKAEADHADAQVLHKNTPFNPFIVPHFTPDRK